MSDEPGADPENVLQVPAGSGVEFLDVAGIVAMALAVVFTSLAAFFYNFDLGFGVLGIGLGVVAYVFGRSDGPVEIVGITPDEVDQRIEAALEAAIAAQPRRGQHEIIPYPPRAS